MKHFFECTLGYFGTFCNESCPPGRFGYRCGGSCSPNCTVEYCNHVSGCHLLTKTTTQLTSSDPVNSPRTSGIIDRSVEKSWTRQTKSLFFTETNTKSHSFSKETPLHKSDINSNYLLAGSGTVIFVLLIVIVIQTTRKSTSAKKKHQTCDETFKRLPNSHSKKYLNIPSSSTQSNHFYQQMDSVYQEIDESVELVQIPTSTETAIEFGEHSLSKCHNKSVSNVTEHDDLNAQTSELYVLPSAESMYPDTDKADYLQPVFVHAKIEIESKQETHSHIDVT